VSAIRGLLIQIRDLYRPRLVSVSTIGAEHQIMHDHPVLGAVLFAIGALTVLISLAVANSGADPATEGLVIGYILVLNGVLLTVLGTSRKARLTPGRL
jgi:hypothetical protein